VIPWEHLASAKVPDSDGELRLMRRGTEYSIMTGGTELMNSRLSGSEKSLATLACAKIADRPAPTILIGGLGMGFTLRAALEVLPANATVIVAEIVPQVVDWARGPLSDLFGDSLDDPRVTIALGDVANPIRAARATFDAMLLDVDNGPGGLDRAANDDLYGPQGLVAARDALTPGGVLAVWSANPNDAFFRMLRRSFAVEEKKVSATGAGKGTRHIIWLATKA
jgi:spermidine synthase